MTRRESTRRLADAPGLGAAVLALAVLLWACRGAPLGSAVADDFFFLAARRFLPLDAFDSMNVPFYWRPISRQAYFTLVGGLPVTAPWAIAALHASMLLALALLLHRAASRVVSPVAALAVSVFPLLAEPARVLLTWPSGSQHLLPALFAALALNEALATRGATFALAALAAALSHESGILIMPALPLIAWVRGARGRSMLGPLAWSAAAGATWLAGYLLAIGHGIRLPGGGGGVPWGSVPGLFARAMSAALNLEDLTPWMSTALAFAHGALAVAAVVLLAPRAARGRFAALRPAFFAGAAWFTAGTMLLVFVLPDWNAWRAWYPAIGFGVAWTLALAAASPWLAAAFATLRLLALLIAPGAPAVVAEDPPAAVSVMSFTRLARLQRMVVTTHDTLLAHHPTLSRGAAVRFWSIPRATLLGFQDSLATQVWYRDPTLVFGAFGGHSGLTQQVDAMLEFEDESATPARVIDVAAIHAFQEAGRAAARGDARAADSLLARAATAHPRGRGAFAAALALNRAFVALEFGEVARADSMVQRSLEIDPSRANAWALAAELALDRGDAAAADTAVRRCLALDPAHASGRRIAARLGI